MKFIMNTSRPLFAGLLLLAGVTGCAHVTPPRVVQTGEPVKLTYTCRLNTGAVIASNDAAVQENGRPDKFQAFLSPGKTDPVPVTAGAAPPADMKTASFEETLAAMLGARIVGLPYGQGVPLKLTAAVREELSDADRFLSLARTRKRPRERTYTRDRYKRANAGKVPAMGETITRSGEPWLTGTVVSTGDDKIVVRYSAPVGTIVDTNFGRGVVTADDKNYLVKLNPGIGRLVAVGGFLGRVIHVGEETFTLDFGHPFGGEPLACDILVTGEAKTAAAPAALKKLETAFGAATGKTEDTAPPGISRPVAAGSPSKQTADQGDVASINFTIADDTGAVNWTNRSGFARGKETEEAETDDETESEIPLDVLIGANSLAPFIENALLAMAPGEKKHTVIPPGDAFGVRDPSRVKSYNRFKYIPLDIKIPADQFAAQYNLTPETGGRVKISPYFFSRITAVEGGMVALRNEVQPGQRFSDTFGDTEVIIADDKIVMKLNPNPDAVFEVDGQKGKIVGVMPKTFEVDFNHPMAGKSFTLDLEMVSLYKKDRISADIDWHGDLGQVFEAGGGADKPVVLVLYAGWCGWSKRFLNETMADPRISIYKDHFTWVKIDSDKEQEMKAYFEQSSYPMTVFMNEKGDVLKKIEGFLSARKLNRELKHLM